MQGVEHVVGFVPLARTTFDTVLAAEKAATAREQLDAAGLLLIEPDGLVCDLDQTTAIAQRLAECPLDLLIVFQSTFADSTMVMKLAQEVDAPLLLWAVPDAPSGGRILLNSLCGINLGGHALKRAGFKFEYVYGEPDDQAAIDRALVLARAGRVRRMLKQARIGRVGTQPDGFDSCLVDAAGLKDTFGLDIVQYDLHAFFGEARAADAAQVDTVRDSLRHRVTGLDELDQDGVRGTLGAYVTLKQMTGEDDLHGLAVRCWPEFFTELGSAACGAMSMMSDEGTPCSCETDINGTITQLMLQGFSGNPAFGTDVVSFDMDEGTAVLWHCGLAPLAMADPESEPRTINHLNRNKPMLMEFPLKPGRVTFARLSEATGGFRLVVGSGEMLRAPRSFSGTSGVVRFDSPAQDVLDTIMSEGLEHHISITYGDFVPELVSLAKLLDIPLLHL